MHIKGYVSSCKKTIIIMLTICCLPTLLFALDPVRVALKSGETFFALVAQVDNTLYPGLYRLHMYTPQPPTTWFFVGSELYCVDEIENIGGEPINFPSDVMNDPCKQSYFCWFKGIRNAEKSNFEKAKSWFKQGSMFYKNRRALKIIDDLEKGIINNEYATLLFKGIVGQWCYAGREDSGKVLEKAIKLNPNYFAAYAEFNDLTYLEKAISLNPDDAEAWFGLASYYIPLFEEQLTRALARARGPASMRIIGVETLNEALSNKKSLLNKAITILEKALKIAPDYVHLLMVRGDVYDTEGRIDKAIEYYEKAIAISPYELLAYLNLATLYDKGGRHQDGYKAYKTAEKIVIETEQPWVGILLEKIYHGRLYYRDAIGEAIQKERAKDR